MNGRLCLDRGASQLVALTRGLVGSVVMLRWSGTEGGGQWSGIRPEAEPEHGKGIGIDRRADTRGMNKTTDGERKGRQD